MNTFNYEKSISKHGSISSGTPQPEWNITDDGRGVLSGTLKVFIDIVTGSTSGAASAPQRGDKHPFDERLICVSSQVSHGTGDIAYAEATYTGLTQDPAGIEWKINCPTEEEQIQLHPKFGKKGEAGLGIVKEEAAAPTWQPVYDESMVVLGGKGKTEFESFKVNQKTIDNDLVGVTSYKVSRPTVSVSLQTANQGLVNDALRNTGKQYAVVPYGPPWLTSTPRTWLFTSCSVTETSGIYKIESEFMLSGLTKPWNKLIYPFAT